MAQILLPQRFLAQPQYPAPFAPGRKPSACFLGSASAELVGRKFRTESDLLGGVRQCGRVRVAVDRFSSDSYPVSIPSLTDFTVYLHASYVDCLDAYQYILGFSAPAPHYLAIPAHHASIGGNWGLFIGVSGVATFISSNEVLPQNQLTAIVITRSGSTIKLFRDGVLKNTVTDSTVIPALSSLTLNSFGPAGDFGSHTGTYFALAGVEPVAWTDDGVKGFSANPWSLFKASDRRLWIEPAPSSEGVGSASGSATVSGVGASIVSTSGSSSGAATVSGVGSFTSEGGGAGSSSGVATVSGVGASIAASTGSASGSASVSGVGGSVAAGSAVGSSNGSATVTGVGASIAASAGTASGEAVVTGKSPVVAPVQDEAFSGGYPVIDHEKRRRKKRLEMGIIEDKPKSKILIPSNSGELKKAKTRKQEPDLLAQQEALNAELRRQIELEREEEEIIKMLMEL